ERDAALDVGHPEHQVLEPAESDASCDRAHHAGPPPGGAGAQGPFSRPRPAELPGLTERAPGLDPHPTPACRRGHLRREPRRSPTAAPPHRRRRGGRPPPRPRARRPGPRTPPGTTRAPPTG